MLTKLLHHACVLNLLLWLSGQRICKTGYNLASRIGLAYANILWLYILKMPDEGKPGCLVVNIEKTEDITGQTNDVNENYLVGGLLDRFFCFLTTTCAISHYIIIVIKTFAKRTSQEFAFALSTCEQIILTVYLLEILVKWYDGFKKFWRSWWNIINFVITLALIVGHRITSHSKALTFIKVLGMIRIFRCCTFSSVILRGIQAITTSIAELNMVFLIFLVFMLAYAVCGVQLFSTTVPSAFGTLPSALYTLFICATQDGWTDIHKKFKEDSEANTFWTFLYFTVFVIFSMLIFALIEAVLIGNVQMFMVDPDEDQSTVENHSDEDRSEDDSIVRDHDMIHVDKLVMETSMTKRQRPLRNSYPENLTIETYEDLILIVSAIKWNLEECNEIQRELANILEEVCNLNATRMHDRRTSVHENILPHENQIMTDLATRDIFVTLLDFDEALEVKEDEDTVFADNDN